MDEATSTDRIVDALVQALQAQGQGGVAGAAASNATAYPVAGTINVILLAQAVESALGAIATGNDGRTAAELNAANDG